MIDVGNDRIAFAILSFGGFLGIGNKHFAIPWQTLRIDREHERLVLDVPKERLEEAPGFDKDDLPDVNDTRWSGEINEFYGVRPYWTAV